MKLLKTDTTFKLSEEEIITRAEQVINSIESKNIIDIFEAISLPFSGDNYKRKVFEKIFKLSNINHKWDENLGLIILSEDRTKRTVVSHMDLIPSFNKGFKNNKIYKIEDNKLIGALDNTFTNAVVIYSILKKQAKDTTYLFTLDEETTQHAIRDYMKRFGKEQFIINLDVTNDGWDNNVSIEYDEPCWHLCKQMNDNIEDAFFTTDRVGDDLDEVLKANGYGFSYCIPTNKTIHSYKNYTLIEKIEPYVNGLDYIVHEMDISEIEENIDYLSIEKSIKHDTFKEMKKKDVLNKIKEKTYNDNISYEYNLDSFTKKSNRFSKVIYALNKKDNIGEFLEQTLFIGDFFREEDIDIFDKNLFYSLLEIKFIKLVYDNYYEFNMDILLTSKFKILEILIKYKNIDAFTFYKYLIDYGRNEFNYDELLYCERNNRAQEISEPIIKMIDKHLIKKIKDKDAFQIL